MRSAASMPTGPASDQRLLGVSVVAALAGPRWWWPLQAVHQTLSAAADDLGFLASYRQVVSNSAFTAGWVQRLWALETPVLNPPVRAQTPAEKEPIILHVGRFFAPEAGHSKRQLELVEAFGALVRSGAVDGWTLHLVGGCDDEGRPYLERVHSAIGGLPVELHPNAGGDELRSLYGRVSIYWHATGLGEDPDAHPERMEHFGIATVEAMSAGAVPVVIGVAGQLEVLDDGVEGYHFATLEELAARTAELVGDPERRARMGTAARQRAEQYGERAFAAKLAALVADRG
ncbi:MAG: glycosyltransferase family 4 protein [Acidimicrobiales bacterium]